MKPLIRAVLWWLPQVALGVMAAIFDENEGHDPTLFLLTVVSSLLGVVCYSLFKQELQNRTRAVFFNLAVFFGTNAVLSPTFSLVNVWVLKWDDPNRYTYQYLELLYYLLLSFSVIYLVVDRLPLWRRISVKYFVTVVIAVGSWIAVYHPYLSDRDWLKNTPEMVDWKMVREVVADFRSKGIAEPTALEIAEVVHLKSIGDLKRIDRTDVQGTLMRVSRILQYTGAEGYAALYWKPLYVDCFWISLLCTLFLVGSMVLKYVTDPPEGAHVEKIVWCLVVFCALEVLHRYAYVETTSWVTLLGVVTLGQYMSIAIMIVLVCLFTMRLRFIGTIEGNYYERLLSSDPNRITRWRDTFDNWVLKHFMNPGELDRRFLTQRRVED